jgi:protein TonB
VRRSPVVALTASALVHGALVTGIVLLLPAADRLAPLFIDLTQEDRPPGGEAGQPGPPASIRPVARGRSGGGRTMARGALPPPAAPTPTAAVPDARPAATAQPAAPEVPAKSEPPAMPAVTAVRERLAAPDVQAAHETSTPPGVPAAPPAERAAVQASDVAPAQAGASDPAPIATSSPSSQRGAGDQGGADSSAGPGPVGAGFGGTSLDAGGGAGQGLALGAMGAGTGDPGAAYRAYLGRLRQRVYEALRYPVAARRRGLTGTVVLELMVKPDGAIGPVAVVQSSSHALLDDAAADTVRGLPPQPFPADLPRRTLQVRLPIVFELRE